MFVPALFAALPTGVADLPMGSAPAALATPHFPDRLHAFVWRNWQLVPPERMASVVGARREDILRMGHAMGLQGPPRITSDQWRRSYVTIIRRNWHILPYEQLLDLLGWTPEQMAFTLREDDFLFVKLGNLKPRCEPLRYTKPDASVVAAEKAIATVVAREFRQGVGSLRRPLFQFVRDLSAPYKAPPQRQIPVTPRFCYSYFGLYGDPLADPHNDPYPNGYLARLAEAGVDGVWLQAVLYKLHPFPWDSRLSEGYQNRLANLRRLVARAKRHGIRVYLYLNEPRAMPLRFYEQHPELRGAVEGDHASLCTSVPEVQAYLRDAIAAIASAVPDLGGFFTITMSENLTNCWSHHGASSCPRCAQRPGAEVIAEVNRLFYDGIQAAGGKQQLIVWDWAWPDDWAECAIRALPRGVSFMSVSEWSLPIQRGGVPAVVGEYSISAVGPGPRAQRHWAIAKDHGLRVLAKIQAGATWEMSAAPYIPAVRLVAEHARNLRESGVDGVMLGWTVGGYPSPNLEVVRNVLSGMTVDEAMSAVAASRYGSSVAPAVVEAWNLASDSFREFPFHIQTVYTGPQHAGPSNLLWLAPTGYHATMVGIPYDDLDSWRSVYPAEVLIQQMRTVAEGFQTAATRLQSLLDDAGSRRSALELELGVLRTCALHFGSTADQAEFIALRNAAVGAVGDERARLRQRMASLARTELERAKTLYDLQMADTRIGFEATSHYYYVPLDLAEKVLNCLDVIRTLERE